MTQAFGAVDLVRAFRQCGVRAGDVLMLHADALVLAQLPPMPAAERYDVLFAALNEVLGPQGTLVMPVFTYSFTRGELFSVEDSPSTVGALTEHFRTLPGVVRSRDPLFSVAARGALAHEFAQAAADDCFGPHSTFAVLERHDGWLACLGCAFDRITFTHYVEQAAGVDYRYFKSFSGIRRDGAHEAPAQVRYFVRDLDRRSTIDLRALKTHLQQNGALAGAAAGRVGLLALPCRVFAQQARALMAERPNVLIAEGASP